MSFILGEILASAPVRQCASAPVLSPWRLHMPLEFEAVRRETHAQGATGSPKAQEVDPNTDRP